MPAVLIVIFGGHMQVEELRRDLYNVVNGWKSLAIVTNCSSLDIGRVSGSTVVEN